ncbi:MAG: hypothetical protein DRH90_01625 [Deltaproteobacteria bacterium]|nr:MAG: hypothetical protein DRH90_01625 [Deltaproteobacteria bacterium]RLC17685.1 MAG: hypothetical protein DRI24_05110 [Deltaproteobacteria bacterium]
MNLDVYKKKKIKEFLSLFPSFLKTGEMNFILLDIEAGNPVRVFPIRIQIVNDKHTILSTRSCYITCYVEVI